MTRTAVLQTPEAIVAEGEVFFAAGELDKAFAAFTQGANAGSATAWMWLSTCHAEGSGTAKSEGLAMSCLRNAARLGQSQAQSNLGVKLIQTSGSTQDNGNDQDAGPGQDTYKPVMNGESYAPSPDILEGLEWLRKAAAQKDVGACFNLGTILSRGKEVAPLWREAAEAYQTAALAGHFPSQIRLGFCYRNGLGVPKDRVQAFLWTALAARHGVGSALEQLEKIVFEMSARERADGEDLLRAQSDPAALTRGAVPFEVVTG